MKRYKEFKCKEWYVNNKTTVKLILGESNKYEKNHCFSTNFFIGSDTERPFVVEWELTLFNKYIVFEISHFMYNRKRFIEIKTEEVGYTNHPYLGRVKTYD